MADSYELCNAGITGQRITAQRARELYDEAAARPESDLDGDLEGGFHYWACGRDGVKLVRRHVVPVPGGEAAGPHLPSESP